MRPEVKLVKDYYESRRRLIRTDEDVLSHSVRSLTPYEMAILVGNTSSQESEREYIFEKVYNRYNDALKGYTLFYRENDILRVRLSMHSSISEVVNDYEEYKAMRSATIHRLKDIEYNPGYVMPVDAIEHAKKVIHNINVEEFDKERQFVLAKE